MRRMGRDVTRAFVAIRYRKPPARPNRVYRWGRRNRIGCLIPWPNGGGVQDRWHALSSNMPSMEDQKKLHIAATTLTPTCSDLRHRITFSIRMLAPAHAMTG